MEFVLTHPDTGTKGILVIFDGVPYEANSDHPWWDEIVRLCLADDERVLDLFPIRPVQKPSQEIAWRAQDHEAGETDPALAALRAELDGPDLRAERPPNSVIVSAFKNQGYTLQGVIEQTGYSLEEIYGWMDEDRSLFQELRAAIEQHRNETSIRERAAEGRWQPHNVEPAEEQDDENPDFPFGKNE